MDYLKRTASCEYNCLLNIYTISSLNIKMRLYKLAFDLQKQFRGKFKKMRRFFDLSKKEAIKSSKFSVSGESEFSLHKSNENIC